MFAICIESSHKRGMGHLFRALNLISYLKEQKEDYILFVNQDINSERILMEQNISYETVDLWDDISDWESCMIQKYRPDCWLNDRLDTGYETASHVKKNNIPLFTIDDLGTGAGLADGNFAGMIFEGMEKIPGKHVYAGEKYLILNPEINRYKRRRMVSPGSEKLIVTLGGSDTYGVTARVVKLLKQADRSATILLGPGSKAEAEVMSLIDERFTLLHSVPSLIAEFSKYDLAITGGGVTPFEANASGLPCIIIANEQHEIQIGRHLEQAGSSRFAGYYKQIDESVFTKHLPITQMSEAGLSLPTEGAKNIYEVLKRGY